MANNFNLGTFPVAVENWYDDYYNYNCGSVHTWEHRSTARYAHPPLKSAETSAVVFKRAIRLSANQLLADAAFRALAVQAVRDGKSYTADLLRWEDKATVRAAVAQLAEGMARKAARRIDTRPDPMATATARRLARLAEFKEWQDRLKSARPLRSMGSTSTGEFRCGSVLVTVRQTESADWDRYSKGWHSKYGPAKTVATRITLETWDRVTDAKRTTTTYPNKLQHIDRRAAEAVAEFLNLPRLRGKAGLRIDPHVALVPERSSNAHTELYRRELGGELLGWVAVRRGEHFHADTDGAAVSGVLTKLATARLQARKRAAGVSLGIDTDKPVGSILRGFGFCRDGVKDALRILGLEDKPYDLSELAAAGEWGRLPAVARKYPSEVDTVRRFVASLPALPARIAALIG